MEMAKRLYMQAQRTTIGMMAMVVAYGGMGYYLIQKGSAGPAILNDSIYPLAKYGALTVSILGVWLTRRWSLGMFEAFLAAVPVPERPPQKLFMRTIVMNSGAQLTLLLGLLLIFFGRRALDFIPFAAISLAGFTLAFPRKQQWSAWLGVKL